MAYSQGGPRLTVLGTGARSLPPAQLAAVLSHERAHLRGRHHLLVTVVKGLAAAAPCLPLTPPAAVRLLMELRVRGSRALVLCGRL
ncbi:M48 family metalloprotease [Micromonospora rhizosphaerae]|uniref:M48 family metalloprotease n=1 Tax=Micromonospora rhizosphaerae TaxID=568872 RepID=UPI001FE19A28|nr:M48 family metalloprotease [Micromonospora rhizosphaerae]